MSKEEGHRWREASGKAGSNAARSKASRREARSPLIGIARLWWGLLAQGAEDAPILAPSEPSTFSSAEKWRVIEQYGAYPL
jgi:hypothetical protein